MTAKQKAEELIAQFATELLSEKQGIECAYIHVCEILAMQLNGVAHHMHGMEMISAHEFYEQVLKEIEQKRST